VFALLPAADVAAIVEAVFEREGLAVIALVIAFFVFAAGVNELSDRGFGRK
jgi:hypothetical protein